MPETLLLTVVAFTVGYLTRPRLESWWHWNKPVRCPECGRWVRYRSTERANHQLAGWVDICRSCSRRLYKPFEGKR